MKTMAFEKGNFSLIALRILPGCKEHLKKILQEEWYLLNNWYERRGDQLLKRLDATLERNLYGENVSVSAIVGKNGSGKSSLMELIFRIVNNLDFCMMQGVTTEAAWPPLFIEGLRAELYFESYGQLGYVRCVEYEVVFKWGEDNAIQYKADNLQGRHDNDSMQQLAYISRHFCFNLVSNYAMMSLNPGDYWKDIAYPLDRKAKNGNWLDSIYNKNDGYTAAIGVEPYKGEGNINLYTQKKLCRARLVGMLIETGQKGEELFDDYSYHGINLKLDTAYMFKQGNDSRTDYEHGGNHLNLELPNLLRNEHCFATVILKRYGYVGLNKNDPTVMMAAAYLAFKTLHVAQIYPQYQNYRRVGRIRYFARDTRAFDKHIKDSMLIPVKNASLLVDSEQKLQDLVDEIKKDKSHVTLKIRQTQNFLNEVKVRYEREGDDWKCPVVKNYEAYMQLFDTKREEYKHINDNADSIMNFFPPPFFETEIFLKRNIKEDGKMSVRIVPYERLSSGEHQFIQTTVSLIYHIKNIASVSDGEGKAKYYNINLFIDEIEACFHPEYQQKFIKLFLGMIRGQNLTEKCNFNIVIATHSPFILSDIPRQNVLYLEEGKLAKENGKMVNPFCGNVCDMLRHSFFLKTGFMGEWAKDMVNDLITYLRYEGSETREEDYQYLFDWDRDKAKAFISMIGEPILKGSLMNKYAEVFGDQEDELLAWHKSEIEKLTKQRAQ